MESTPPGAVVRLDEEVLGTTPLTYKFTHGGERRLTLYRPGYHTWSRRVDLELPWYSRFPMDVLTEVILPLGLKHDFPFHVQLTPDTGSEQAISSVETYLHRARQLRETERALEDAAKEAAAKEAAAQEDTEE